MNHEANYTSISGVPSGHNIHFSSQQRMLSIQGNIPMDLSVSRKILFSFSFHMFFSVWVICKKVFNTIIQLKSVIFHYATIC